jgi:RHS repeat-associated protein
VAQTDKLYTGQRQEAGDAALGLYNYKARFYSTTLGRFVSADPVVGSPSDPQSWNAYTYVRNNPLRLVDPTGMCIPDITCPSGVDAAAARRDAGFSSAACNLTCLSWKAAARAYQQAQAATDYAGALIYLKAQHDLAQAATSEGGGGGGGCGGFSLVCDIGAGVKNVGEKVLAVEELGQRHAAGSIADAAMGAEGFLASCDWGDIVGGTVLTVAGVGLVAIGVGGGALILGAEGAGAPATGGGWRPIPGVKVSGR